jgi:dipeptidyl aminopeptidase/acylaminoacyl peptidase
MVLFSLPRRLTPLVLATLLVDFSLPVCVFGTQSKRPIDASDAIEMTQVENVTCPSDASSSSEAGVLSPDRSRFLLVLSRGDLRKNVNEYSLRVFDPKELRPGLEPRTLVTMRSSDTPAIKDTCWMKDNRTILFIGTRAEGDTALYSLNAVTGALKRLTPRSTPVMRYAVTNDDQGIVYISSLPYHSKPGPRIQPDVPFVVEGQSLLDLITGNRDGKPALAVYWKPTGQAGRKEWAGEGLVSNFLSVSPNGRYAVICKPVLASELPKEWEGYNYGPDNAIIKPLFRLTHSNAVVPFQRYLVIDVLKHTVFPLWDGPRLARGFQELRWLADGRSILLHDVFLPHMPHSPPQPGDVPDKHFDVKIDLDIRAWEPQANIEWTRPAKPQSPLRISLEQSLNEPPRLAVTTVSTGEKVFLSDLNAQFQYLQFGTARIVTWQVHGITVKSGLYLPPDYNPNIRYPLVIQTHGFDDSHFSMDGNREWSSAFAARLLAAKGIVVLQTYDFSNHIDHDKIGDDPTLGLTLEERYRTFAKLVYESAIPELDKRKSSIQAE